MSHPRARYRRSTPQKLPKHPDWQLAPEPSARPGQLTLRYGDALLRIRFWPRASAALRPTRDSPWIPGDRHAGRLLRRYFSRVRFRQLSIHGQWHWFDHTGQIYFPFISQHSEEMGNTPAERAFIAAIAEIPQDVLAAIFLYRTQHWAALQLASRIRAAAELLNDHPQLFWLWLDRHVGNKLPSCLSRASRGRSDRRGQLARRRGDPAGVVPVAEVNHRAHLPFPHTQLKYKLMHPRRIQLSMLGFSSDKFWLQILRKIPTRQLHTIDWTSFARLTRSGTTPEQTRFLQHAERLPAPLICALADPVTRPLASLPLLQSHLRQSRADLHGRLRHYQQYYEKFPSACHYLRPPNKVDQLIELTEGFKELLEEHETHGDTMLSSPFPCPEYWTHLNTLDRIAEEGFLQQNCLKDDAASYLRGTQLLYRVEAPIRATLHVDRTEAGYWYIRQCAGPRNQAIPPHEQHALLCKLTGREIADPRRLRRIVYHAAPAPSTPLYQRLVNNRALWALHNMGLIGLVPEELEIDLRAGDAAIYRMRKPEPCTIQMKWEPDYGWEMHRLLHKDDTHAPSPAPFMMATHILWQHYADLHAHGFDTPTWTTPHLPLENYRPVRNLWELLHFRWQTGSSVSLKDILKNGWLFFYCTVAGYDLACIAMPILEFWEVTDAYARGAALLNERTSQAEALCDRLRARIDEALDPDTEEPARLNPGSKPIKMLPTPKLPPLSQAEQLNQPEFRRVYL